MRICAAKRRGISRTPGYGFRAIAARLCALLLAISISAFSTSEWNNGPGPLLTPLTTTLVPFGTAIQSQPVKILSALKAWTVNKRFALFVGHGAFTARPNDFPNYFRGIRPVLLAGVGTGYLARSPPLVVSSVSVS